jgi:hypothetical protein
MQVLKTAVAHDQCHRGQQRDVSRRRLVPGDFLDPRGAQYVAGTCAAGSERVRPVRHLYAQGLRHRGLDTSLRQALGKEPCRERGPVQVACHGDSLPPSVRHVGAQVGNAGVPARCTFAGRGGHVRDDRGLDGYEARATDFREGQHTTPFCSPPPGDHRPCQGPTPFRGQPLEPAPQVPRVSPPRWTGEVRAEAAAYEVDSSAGCQQVATYARHCWLAVRRRARVHDSINHCVYLYRDPNSQKIVYVGRGASPGRAVQHTGGSHNAGLRAIIDEGNYSVELAGPYSSMESAAAVEAALISALRLPTSQAALTNAAQGEGPRFRPFGVPADYVDRLLLPPLTVREVGEITGGALIVRNSFGGELAPGRPRLDPLHPQDDVIAENLSRYWLLARLVPKWLSDVSTCPKVILGAAGPIRHRFVPGASFIDTARIGTGDPKEVPLVQPLHLDACGLRGRMLAGVKFDLGRQSHFLWVTGDGAVAYDTRRARTPKIGPGELQREH